MTDTDSDEDLVIDITAEMQVRIYSMLAEFKEISSKDVEVGDMLLHCSKILGLMGSKLVDDPTQHKEVTKAFNQSKMNHPGNLKDLVKGSLGSLKLHKKELPYVYSKDKENNFVFDKPKKFKKKDHHRYRQYLSQSQIREIQNAYVEKQEYTNAVQKYSKSSARDTNAVQKYCETSAMDMDDVSADEVVEEETEEDRQFINDDKVEQNVSYRDVVSLPSGVREEHEEEDDDPLSGLRLVKESMLKPRAEFETKQRIRKDHLDIELNSITTTTVTILDNVPKDIIALADTMKAEIFDMISKRLRIVSEHHRAGQLIEPPPKLPYTGTMNFQLSETIQSVSFKEDETNESAKQAIVSFLSSALDQEKQLSSIAKYVNQRKVYISFRLYQAVEQYKLLHFKLNKFKDTDNNIMKSILPKGMEMTDLKLIYNRGRFVHTLLSASNTELHYFIEMNVSIYAQILRNAKRDVVLTYLAAEVEAHLKEQYALLEVEEPKLNFLPSNQDHDKQIPIVDERIGEGNDGHDKKMGSIVDDEQIPVVEQLVDERIGDLDELARDDKQIPVVDDEQIPVVEQPIINPKTLKKVLKNQKKRRINRDKWLDVLKTMDMKVVSIPGDGYCVYRAVLGLDVESSEHLDIIRDVKLRVAQNLRDMDHFEGYLELLNQELSTNYKTWDEYLKDVESMETKLWGGQYELIALAKVLNKVIILITCDIDNKKPDAESLSYQEFQPEKIDSETTNAFIKYNGISHYDRIELLNTHKSKILYFVRGGKLIKDKIPFLKWDKNSCSFDAIGFVIFALDTMIPGVFSHVRFFNNFLTMVREENMDDARESLREFAQLIKDKHGDKSALGTLFIYSDFLKQLYEEEPKNPIFKEMGFLAKKSKSFKPVLFITQTQKLGEEFEDVVNALVSECTGIPKTFAVQVAKSGWFIPTTINVKDFEYKLVSRAYSTIDDDNATNVKHFISCSYVLVNEQKILYGYNDLDGEAKMEHKATLGDKNSQNGLYFFVRGEPKKRKAEITVNLCPKRQKNESTTKLHTLQEDPKFNDTLKKLRKTGRMKLETQMNDNVYYYLYQYLCHHEYQNGKEFDFGVQNLNMIRGIMDFSSNNERKVALLQIQNAMLQTDLNVLFSLKFGDLFNSGHNICKWIEFIYWWAENESEFLKVLEIDE
ncbi:hypothetical protein BC833DRAFT_625217 [Globomyces pollinis-pini]|nr:hypothetical protein BC833DRAFT_625217 [Globomyces pollinis-pini]